MTNIFWIQNGKIRKTTSDDSRISVACRAFKAQKYDEAFKMFRELAYESFENYDAQYYTAVMEIYELGCQNTFPSSEMRVMEALVWCNKLHFICQDSDFKERAQNLLPEYFGKKQVMNPSPLMFFRPMDNNRMLFFDQKLKKCGFKDCTGKIVIPCKYEAAVPFQGGISVVRMDNKYCLINTSGDVISSMYDQTGCVFGGRVYCRNGNTVYLVSSNGKKLKTLEGKYTEIYSLYCKYAGFRRADGGLEFYNFAGERVLNDIEITMFDIVGNKMFFVGNKGVAVESVKLEW
jgi:hypothetical protein